ncbi:MAG: transcription antitermination factor NusB [Armatimonadetes bacterium]|nr:transcription antitermination factor NusB [Armatimonadota bacterium]
MGSRRISRELALRALFQTDIGRAGIEEAVASSDAQGRYSAETLEFARELALGTANHRDRIDRLIGKYARDWTMDRMANVDRNILRLAVFELLYLPDIPLGVTVDEAVELAKKYSTAESGKFVNGILGNLVRNLDAEAAEPDTS